MNGDVVVSCRVRFRVPAAAPEPYNRRQESAWGHWFPCRRLMRAILNAARIQNLFRRERDFRAICNGAVFPAGRTVGAGLLDYEDRTCKPVRRIFRALLNVCQDAKRGVSNHLKTPFVVAVNHVRTRAWSKADDVQRNSEAGA